MLVVFHFAYPQRPPIPDKDNLPPGFLMSSQPVKRQRTLMAEPCANNRATATNKTKRTPQNELGITRLQVERTQSAGKVYEPFPMACSYQPTYRASLAKKGLLVRQTLGAGTYSKVKMGLDYSATASEKGAKVAVKIVDRALAPRDYLLKFMPRELKLWPSLQHPNLVPLKDWFQDYRRTYMVLEYLEGGDCLKYIQQKGPVSEGLARHWMMQTLDAVRYLHLRDISHRDLKLENLLLDSECNVKVCDFGFVKDHCSASLSMTFCGSKSYVAPEILHGSPYNPKRADVWAMAVILYIMVTGKMPFDEFKGTTSILHEQRQLKLYWPQGLSSRCRSLVRRMFTFPFVARPTVSDVLKDYWFKGEASAWNNKLQPSPAAVHVCPDAKAEDQTSCKKGNASLQPCRSKSDDIVITSKYRYL